MYVSVVSLVGVRLIGEGWGKVGNIFGWTMIDGYGEFSVLIRWCFAFILRTHKDPEYWWELTTVSRLNSKLKKDQTTNTTKHCFLGMKKNNIEFLFHNYPVDWKSSSGTRNNKEKI